jgi:hypothetical protein
VVPPNHILRSWRRRDFPSSQGIRVCLCPALRPRRDHRTRPLRYGDTAPAVTKTKAAHDNKAFGAQSHGLGTRCLRFVGEVTRPRRKTRFWLLAKLYQAGLTTRRIPTRGFQMVPYIASSSPGLSWRNVISFFASNFTPKNELTPIAPSSEFPRRQSAAFPASYGAGSRRPLHHSHELALGLILSAALTTCKWGYPPFRIGNRGCPHYFSPLFLSCVYYYEHQDLNRNVVEVPGREAGRFRIRWTGTTELSTCDGSEPDSQVVIDGLFEFVGAEAGPAE